MVTTVTIAPTLEPIIQQALTTESLLIGLASGLIFSIIMVTIVSTVICCVVILKRRKKRQIWKTR